LLFDAPKLIIMSLQDKRIFASWSGGKDSCLALYKAMQGGGQAVYLLTMMTEQGQRSRSHGLHSSVIEAQAAALALPLMVVSTSWDAYEEHFVGALGALKDHSITDGIFGDIDLEPHREWVEKVCARQDMTPHLPLWQEERRTLLADFIDAGFAATIVTVNNERLDSGFLGRTLDWHTIDDLEKAGVDACGEEGEYHTVVTDGPIFSHPLNLNHGEVVSQEGYSFLDVSVTPSEMNT
jgi:diphthine-ammonia ligase